MKKVINKLFCSLFLSFILSGCASQSAQITPTQVSKTALLRIINNGSTTITNLVVRFPSDSISFGDVPAGMTTEYKEAPNGVYRYAAYRFEVRGNLISQDVTDWMGEYSMDGNLFTYVIDFDFSRFPMNESVRLIEIKVDN
ncbi:MAG: hypothetical protein H7Y59_03435 [Anaerolineales bacterium]|nr:hypothetical protein [Anaerolineales bacterium]